MLFKISENVKNFNQKPIKLSKGKRILYTL